MYVSLNNITKTRVLDWKLIVYYILMVVVLCAINTANRLRFPGNDNLHAITAQKKYTLRVDLADFEGQQRYAKYTDFAVGNEANKYRLTLGSYSGTAGDYDYTLFFP